MKRIQYVGEEERKCVNWGSETRKTQDIITADTSIIVVQSLSGVQLCVPMDCSTPGFPVLHYLLVCPNSCPDTNMWRWLLWRNDFHCSGCQYLFRCSGAMYWVGQKVCLDLLLGVTENLTRLLDQPNTFQNIMLFLDTRKNEILFQLTVNLKIAKNCVNHTLTINQNRNLKFRLAWSIWLPRWR